MMLVMVFVLGVTSKSLMQMETNTSTKSTPLVPITDQPRSVSKKFGDIVSYPGFDGHLKTWTMSHEEVFDDKAREISEGV